MELAVVAVVHSRSFARQRAPIQRNNINHQFHSRDHLIIHPHRLLHMRPRPILYGYPLAPLSLFSVKISADEEISGLSNHLVISRTHLPTSELSPQSHLVIEHLMI